MGKLRLQFAKEGKAVYISHLDLLRTFQRIFARRGLAIRHSQGFHPHPILSFALPLPVGQSSVCELLDFETAEPVRPDPLAAELAPFAPEGLRPIRCYEAGRPIGELARLRCQVEFIYDQGVPAEAGERISALLTGPALVIQKRTKHKELADVDIRPMLHSLRLTEGPGVLQWEAVVSAQNPGLNPALLAAAVERYLPEYRPDFVRAGRLALLDGQGKPFA